MLDINESRAIFEKIYNNAELTEKLVSYVSRHKAEMKFYIALGRKKNWILALKRKPFVKLCIIFAYLPTVKRLYSEAGIGDGVFFETMDDIRIWIDDHRARTGEWGLYEMHWIVNHLNLELFRLGRLQFQKSRYFLPKPYENGETELKIGDRVLAMHIPRGGRLDPAECDESILRAKEFFAEFCPEYRTDCFSCFSWLLYPGNANFMKADDNILKFSARFDKLIEHESPHQTYLWLFGVKENSPKLIKNRKATGSYGHTENLPRKSELQLRAIEYIENGGQLGDAYGIMKA